MNQHLLGLFVSLVYWVGSVTLPYAVLVDTKVDRKALLRIIVKAFIAFILFDHPNNRLSH